jgi:hypothetical protein
MRDSAREYMKDVMDCTDIDLNSESTVRQFRQNSSCLSTVEWAEYIAKVSTFNV